MKLNKKLIAVPAIALAAGIGLAACGSSGGSSSGGSSAPAAAAPAAASAVSQWDTWASGPGHADSVTVQNDLTQMSTDAGNDDSSSVESDGSTLATDAQTAIGSPPPIDGADYIAAMNDDVTAGNDAANGDFTDATTALQNGETLINKVTAAATAAGVSGN
jgi:hypothetical protein